MVRLLLCNASNVLILSIENMELIGTYGHDSDSEGEITPLKPELLPIKVSSAPAVDTFVLVGNFSELNGEL